MSDKKDLIHKLYQKFSGESEKEKESRYSRSTGTLFADPENDLLNIPEREEKEPDPWDKLELKPRNIK